MFPCVIEPKTTACTNNFSTLECLFRLWRGFASQWQVRKVMSTSQQLLSLQFKHI